MSEEVKLLGATLSPFSMRVRIGLEEKGVLYDFQEENLGQKSDLLLRSNPVHKQVPVLLHNGKAVLESLTILEYIDETWPATASLLPSEPFERAQARFWADFIDRKMVKEGATVIMRSKGEEQAKGKSNLLECMGIVEGVLGDKPYFGGDEFGLVDVALIPFTSWIKAYEAVANFSIPLETHFPNINEWMKRCLQRDTVKKTLPEPEKVVQLALFLRKMFVGEE